MRIVGLDVCKLSVVACVLDSARPIEPRQFHYEANYRIFQANALGVSSLLELKPDIALLEPTGVNYSKLWGTHLVRAGVEVRLVGHSQLRGYRKNVLQLPDKDDEADALALACYGFDFLSQCDRFVQIRVPTIALIRQLVLRLAHLNRVQSPIINRIRQDLAWQFPEVASVKSTRTGDTPPLLWMWLAGEKKSTRYDNLYQNSCGLGLQDTVREHAKRLVDIHREEVTIERKLAILMGKDEFTNYRKVFARFGFGRRIEAMLISQIYPFENYLKDNKPIVRITRGRKSGNKTKKHLSLRRFTKALGVAPTEESSGDRESKHIVGGSDLCRRTLWQWLFTQIEVLRSRPKNEICNLIGDRLDNEKASGRPVRLIRMRVSAYAVKLLFYELVNNLN